MKDKLFWAMLGWLWFWLGPAAAPAASAAEKPAGLGQTAPLCTVVASPHCIRRPGEVTTFTYTMANTGETRHFVICQDTERAELITLFPNESDSRIFTFAAGAPTYRLHLRAWCKVFGRNQFPEAEACRQTAQLQVDIIRQSKAAHEGVRATLETLDANLIAAIGANEGAAITALQSQISTIEGNDDGHLTNIEFAQAGIDGAFGHPSDADAIVVKLDLHPFQPNFQHVPEAAKLSPGFRLLKNGDDDNANAIPDFDDVGGVTGENETGQTWWFFARPVDVTEKMRVGSAAPGIQTYRQRNKRTPDPLPKEISAAHERGRVFLEGRAGSSAYLAEEINLTFHACQDRARGTVDEITRVDFEFETPPRMFNNDLNHQVNGNPNAGGGDRLFPDRNTPIPGTLNNRIRVKARIRPERAGVAVWLRPYDVDDPSQNTAGNVVDDETSDEDNRGVIREGGRNYREGFITGAEPNGIIETTTNGDGVADVEYQTTIQPGDNFRVVAGLKREFVTATKVRIRRSDATARLYSATSDLPITDNTGVPNLWKQSNLLTIWRQLHIELDSMAAPGGANQVNGLITAFAGNLVTTDQALADVNMYRTEPVGNLEARFNSGGEAYEVVANTAGPASTVRILVAPGQPPPVVGAPFTLTDDDVNTRIPQLPDTGRMQHDYNRAYILLMNDEGGTAGSNNQTVAFAANLANTNVAGQAQINLGFATNANRSDDFWVVYVQSGFQMAINRDGDPNVAGENQDGSAGYAPLAADGRGVMIFREAMRDLGSNVILLTPAQIVLWEQLTVVHEVGHLFNLEHADGGVMGAVDPRTVPTLEFSDASLHNLRRRMASPGTNTRRGGP